MKKNYNYKLIDLFAGCGGLSLGFENKGFEPIFVNEVNHDALTTYLKNRYHKFNGISFNQIKDLHQKKQKNMQEDFSLVEHCLKN